MPGWAHARVAGGAEPWQRPEERVAQIRLLLFPRQRRDAGYALAAQATRWLSARGHARPFALGARHASPGTQVWNHPAQATYARLGFVPHTVMAGRQRKAGC